MTKAQAFMNDALIEHQKFFEGIRTAKAHAFDCGLLLLSARDSVAPGEWLTLLADYEDRLSKSSAYRYMRFAADMLEWAQLDKPRLKGDKLAIYAREMVMQSAIGFLELCREVAGILRPLEGGGRRSEKHGQGQLFFDFQFFSDTLFLLGQGGKQLLRDVPAPRLQQDRNSLETALQVVQEEIADRELAAFLGARAETDAREKEGAEQLFSLFMILSRHDSVHQTKAESRKQKL